MMSNTHRLRSGLAVAGIVTAMAAPAAWARPVVEPADFDGSDYSRPANAYVVHEPPAPVASSSDGFDWGDAGIGATAIVALAAIGAGATVAARGRPQRRGHTIA